MEQKINEVEINGIVYIPKDSVNIELAEKVGNMDFVLVRTHSAGVHFGYLKEKIGNEVVLINSRRIWYWKGAASLSQIALEGIKCPNESKISVAIPKNHLFGVIEIMDITKEAEKSLNNINEWRWK